MKVKAGDTSPIQWKANADLTGATVRLIAKLPDGDPVELDAVVTDASEGLITHTLTGTLAPGEYYVELEVTQGSAIATFPNDGYSILTVTADLD